MPIDRREFLAGIGGFGLGLGLGGASHWFPLPLATVGRDWAPGQESFVSSTCTLCPSHCGIRGRIVDGKLVAITGNPLHPISRGGLCAKGLAGIQLLYHPARLTGPLERTGPPGSSEFKRVSWDYALQKIVSKLGKIREQGNAHSVMWLTGETSGLTRELIEHFAAVYGTPHVIREDYADATSEVVRLTHGIDAPPAFDLAASDYVLSFGVPLFESWSGLAQAASAREVDPDEQRRWVQLDVRYSRTASRADEWVGIRPGTFGILALGIAYVILKEGLYDAETVRENVVGLEDTIDVEGQRVPGFRTLVAKHGRTAEVAKKTGVRAETIIHLAKELGSARRPVAVWDHAVTWRSGGLADALAIHALNVLVGAVDRPGGMLVQPPLPVPPIFGSGTRGGAPADEKETSSLTRGNWAALVGAGTAPPPEVLFLYYSNPVASSPSGEEVVRALKRVPLVVSFSPFLDETAKHANLVLPDCTYLERWQDAAAPPSVPIPVWGVVQPMVAPLHDTKATGDVILDLASRLGGDVAKSMPASSLEDLVRQRGIALASAKRGGVFDESLGREELRELESRGWWVPHGKSEDDFWDTIRKQGGWFDPYYDYDDRSVLSQFDDGKIRLISADARRRVGLSAAEISAGALVADAAEEPAGSGYPLALVPYRVMTLASGQTALMPWLLESLGLLTGRAWETWVEIAPADAADADVRDGDAVAVESRFGRFAARTKIFAGAQPGVVNVPYGLHTVVEGWGSIEGSNPLRAVGNRLDAVTGLPDWYSARVRIVPL